MGKANKENIRFFDESLPNEDDEDRLAQSLNNSLNNDSFIHIVRTSDARKSIIEVKWHLDRITGIKTK